MAYLEVTVRYGSAICANGVSLNKGGFFSDAYPSMSDYFEALEDEGWEMISAQSQRSMLIIDGLPLANNSQTYVFRGSGRFEVAWNDDNCWRLVSRAELELLAQANVSPLDEPLSTLSNKAISLILATIIACSLCVGISIVVLFMPK